MKTKGDVTMSFKITKASYFTNEWSFSERFKEENKPCKNAFLKVYENGNKEWVVEINTLEELIALRKEVNEELVIGLNDTITIYDDFIE